MTDRFDEKVLNDIFDNFERKLTPYLNSGNRDDNLKLLDRLEETIRNAYARGAHDSEDHEFQPGERD